MRQRTYKPIRKIQAVIGTAIITPAGMAVLLTWVLPTFMQIDVPPDVALVIGSIITGVMASIAGYYTSPSPLDGVVSREVKNDKTQ